MANRLREFREKAELSQRLLSTISGVSQYLISSLENQNQKAWPAHRKKLAIALEAKEEDIFPDECAEAQRKAEAKAAKEAKIERLKANVFAQSVEDFE